MVDWLAPIHTSVEILWYSGTLAIHSLYLLTTPLLYPIYLSFSAIAFVLSPIWLTVQAFMDAGVLMMNALVKLRYIYYYLAFAVMSGIFAAILLHISSYGIFHALGILSGQQPLPEPPKPAITPQEEPPTEQDSDGTYSADSSSLLSGASSPLLLRRTGRDPIYHRGPLESTGISNAQWRLLVGGSTSKPPPLTLKPRKKFRGLLAQTIHEESSESDSL